ncbi:hypothetical protein RSM1_27015 [Methylobacterium radiotolerans]|nr:hypothetical protein RSM1_27015 [Methylobacterium radiotolerans]
MSLDLGDDGGQACGGQGLPFALGHALSAHGFGDGGPGHPGRAQLPDDGQAGAYGAGDAGGLPADVAVRPLGLGALRIAGEALGIEGHAACARGGRVNDALAARLCQGC